MMNVLWWKRGRWLKPDGEGDNGTGTATAPPAVDPREVDRHFDAVDDELDDGEGEAGGAADRAIEQQALVKGWTPKDKFRGDPAKWVDAKTFVERGERFASNLKNENSALKRQLEEFKGTAEAFRRFHDEVVAGKQKEIDEAIKGLKRQVRESEGDRDYETADAAESRIKLLEEQKAKVQQEAAQVQQTAPQQMDPTLRAWIDEDNQWFEQDGRLRAYSIEVGTELKKLHPTLLGRPFLDRVRQIMEEDFPQKFGAVQRRSMAEGGGGRRMASSASERSIRDLPKADRDLCRQFVKEGWVTEESFVKSYFERNPS
jgi:hypothetical protein